MKSVFRMFRRKRYAIGVVAVIVLTLCTVSFASTLAVCRIQVDHPDLPIDPTVSGFMGRDDYTTQDLILQAEQRVDSYFGIWSQPSRSVWNQGIYYCREGNCDLQELHLEIDIVSLFPCWIDESGTTLGFTQLNFDIAENSVQGFTGWFDRPIGQGPAIRVSEFSPTMDEATLQIAATLPAEQAHILHVYAGWGNWEIWIQNMHGTTQSEEIVAFDQPDT